MKVKRLILSAQISAGLHMDMQSQAPFMIKAVACEGDINGEHVHRTHVIDIRTLGYFSMDDFRAVPREQVEKLVENEIEKRRNGPPAETV